MSSIINENKLFGQLKYFFNNPGGVLIELAQNAQRAGANSLKITLNNDILIAEDDGCGIDDVKPLLILADSDWSEYVEANHNPAGWGLFYLICMSDNVTFKSSFGSVSIDCDAYLYNKKYRENALKNLNPTDKTEKGFYLHARLKKDKEKAISERKDSLCFFPLDVLFNGEAVERKNAADLCNGYEIKTVYKGSKVFIDPYRWGICHFYDHRPLTPEDLKLELRAIWYGIPIPVFPHHRDAEKGVVIDVTDGSPLTPVLPYRDAIQDDEKLAEFWEFVRTLIVGYCTDKINSGGEKDKHDLISLMEVMQRVATRDELNALNRFYVEADESYYSEDTDGSSQCEKLVIARDNVPLCSEELKLFEIVDGGEKTEMGDPDGFILPQGAITEITTLANSPDWVKDKVQEKVCEIVIAYSKKDCYKGNYTWHKAVITADKKIAVISEISGCSDGRVFYIESPRDFDEIGAAVFAQRIYSDDGDTYDSQQYYFDQDIERDIANIMGDYKLYDLFEGLQKADVSPSNIKNIKVNRKSVVVTLKGGKQKILKLAA